MAIYMKTSIILPVFKIGDNFMNWKTISETLEKENMIVISSDIASQDAMEGEWKK